MPNNIGSFLSNAGLAFGIGAILVGLGMYGGTLKGSVSTLDERLEGSIGTLEGRLETLEEHPAKDAHVEQLKETVRSKLLLQQILARGASLENATAVLPQLVAKIDRLEKTVATLKADILTEVAVKFADERWRRGDMYDLCRRTEARNPGWKCVFPNGGGEARSQSLGGNGP